MTPARARGLVGVVDRDGDTGGGMNATSRAWECAYLLASDYRDRLTPQQAVAAIVEATRGPGRADLAMIALAAQVIGDRT